MATTEVTIRRTGYIIVIDGTQASVTFHPRDKDKTYSAIIEKCIQLDRAFWKGGNELEYLKRDIDVQLTGIYQDYDKEQEAKRLKNPHVRIINKPTPQPEVIPPKVDVSFQDWQLKLKEKLDYIQRLAEEYFPEVWEPLEFALSVKCILHIRDCNLPFMGIVLGPPSSFKTFVLELFRLQPHTFYTDSFSAKAFVSHNTAVSAEELKDIDMLPKIKNKVFLTPELAPTFSAREEELTNIFGIITRILDGQGYESDTGAQGHRGYSGEFMFTWLGAVVEIPRKVHHLLSTLGPKMYFFRLQSVDQGEEGDLKRLLSNDYHIRRKELVDALTSYLNWFEQGPTLERINNIPKMRMESDNVELLRKIISLAKLLAHLRGSVPTWQTKGTQGSEYAYSLPVIEAHSRAMTQLCNLARGHALSQGRTTICREDLKVVIKTVLSTAPIERVAIFDLLLANAGRLTTSQITAGLNTTNPTAKRTMTELKALGLVEKKSGDSYNTEWQIELVKEFAWFMSSEFAELREGFKPSDNRPYLKMLKEKSSPPTSDDLKEGRNNSVERGGNFSFSINENVFLKVFLDLQKESLDGTVRYDRLKRGLISSGKFTAGDAYQATKDAVKARILTVVDFEVYKIREENSN